MKQIHDSAREMYIRQR